MKPKSKGVNRTIHQFFNRRPGLVGCTPVAPACTQKQPALDTGEAAALPSPGVARGAASCPLEARLKGQEFSEKTGHSRIKTTPWEARESARQWEVFALPFPPTPTPSFQSRSSSLFLASVFCPLPCPLPPLLLPSLSVPHPSSCQQPAPAPAPAPPLPITTRLWPLTRQNATQCRPKQEHIDPPERRCNPTVHRGCPRCRRGHHHRTGRCGCRGE